MSGHTNLNCKTNPSTKESETVIQRLYDDEGENRQMGRSFVFSATRSCRPGNTDIVNDVSSQLSSEESQKLSKSNPTGLQKSHS